MKRSIVGVVVLLSVMLPIVGISAPEVGVLKLKAGECGFHILDVNGVKPLADAKVAVLSVKDGKSMGAATSDKLGKCTIKIAEGRYLLSVKDVNVSVIDVSADAELAQCRLVMPNKPLQVGAQGPAPLGGAPLAGGGGLLLTSPLVIGGLVAIAIAVPVALNNTRNSSPASP